MTENKGQQQADQNLTFPSTPMKPLVAAAALAEAGWPESQWATGVAVGQAESSLNIGARNQTGGNDAVGWLQINKKSHADLFKGMETGYEWLDPVENAKLGLSVYKAAGNSWSPWEAYTGADGRGADGPWTKYQSEGQSAAAQLKNNLAGKSKADQTKYLKSLTDPWKTVAGTEYLGIAEKSVGQAIGDTGVTAAQTAAGAGAAVASTVSDMVKEFAAFSDFFQALLLPSTWLRIGSGIVGIGLIIGGMVALGKEASA